MSSKLIQNPSHAPAEGETLQSSGGLLRHEPCPESFSPKHDRLGSEPGQHDHSEYRFVKAGVAAAKAAHRSRIPNKNIQLVDLDPSEFSEAAAALQFKPIESTPLVSVIIPVFNNIKLTLECLTSLSHHTSSNLTVEILVADDGSQDETQEILKTVPNIRYLRSEHNRGFLRNCNKALPNASGAFIVLLNNDVQVTPGWLDALLDTFVQFKDAGVVGPKFVYPSGHLQEAGVSLAPDGLSTMIGYAEHPDESRFNYTRRVDYVSGACLIVPASLLKRIGGFSEEFLPCYCEDSDLCLTIRSLGYEVYYNPHATIIHHLSRTTTVAGNDFKMASIAKNISALGGKWGPLLEQRFDPRLIAFFLPQFHPVPENDFWWGKGFTEWTNVSKAKPNFSGHYQPRLPADLGYYDLRLTEVLQAQADLAQRYGIHGFCFYYYWFGGKRLLERPLEQLLQSDKPNIPFCLCWANENWTRRWDGLEKEVLIAQDHSDEDDLAVIQDLIRYFKDDRYIKIDGRPVLVIYRPTLFPDFVKTAARWRDICREYSVGEIYIAMVESFELAKSGFHPSLFGCDAAIEFPPGGLVKPKPPTGDILNPDYTGHSADYRELAVSYASRPAPAYTRFKGVMPGWDNTARRQNAGNCFEHSTPGAFQAWLEEAIAETREQQFGDERLVFINAWNEWAEGAYLEPDRRFGHAYLEAVRNALDASRLLKKT